MGKTIIVSSHILADLEEICSDVGIIEQGQLVWSGPLQRLATLTEEGKVSCVVEVDEKEAERAVTLLRALNFVSGCKLSSGSIQVELNGRQGNDVLQALGAAGIEILSFTLEKVDLEALFLDRTRGVVS